MGLPLLAKNTLINNRFEVESKIGEGTFSEIFRVRDISNSTGKGNLAAVKVEKEETVLKFETNVLRKLQDCEYVCRLIQSGTHNALPFLVMELLGENLAELRRKQRGNRFSLSTTARLGKQMLSALEGCHKLGYLHRDVKPSNFAVGFQEKTRNCYVIDFGLSKKFVDDDGEVLPARENAQFRGTCVYASVNAHLHKDLGRRDDLWSLLYVLVEFLEGDLPWRSLQDKEKVRQSKELYNRSPETMMTEAMPEELKAFAMYLRSLDFQDEPDYDFLLTRL
eukprot:CAMPEP_0198218560 /NCGR_PEP_ID=MMETSP1445-20131203/69940_1 /TAXON_ID=36898 /ORGANISM="Pyramimonas sp., Strain CCMP2087" /LENGTH=278 /DNA_ID=CAMNT_0043895643 /DNA_START=356 /DNA_END=1189 /DNA_ORIENTATION=-